MKEKIFIVGIIVYLLIISFSGCIEGESKIIYVDYRGKADYTKIQDAIDNASRGDTVFVRNGTYYESILINKPINLIGASKNQTIIVFKKKYILKSSGYICIKHIRIIRN